MSLKHKVLLVDDEPAIIKVFGIKLRSSGYEVVTAVNGIEALDKVISEKPNIMLLDVIMPGMDGFEVLQKLRTFSKLPVIVFSARPDYSQQAMNLGANSFFAKPFDIDELIKRIERLVDNKGR